jgi:hypothetical protein
MCQKDIEAIRLNEHISNRLQINEATGWDSGYRISALCQQPMTQS